MANPDTGGAGPGPALAPEECKLLRLLSEGKSLARVARELQVSERTARRRVTDVCRRLGVGTAIEAVVWAVRREIV